MPIELLNNSANWNNEELTVYKAKYIGQPFGKMSQKQLVVNVTGISFRIAVITGCQLPTDQRHINALEVEISKLLTENKAFATLTFEEILSAFRLNASGRLGEKVKHWQNIFNLDYLGEVLNNWVYLRDSVEKKIEDEEIKMESFIALPGPKLSDDEIIEIARDVWVTTKNHLYISTQPYEILLTRGEIKLSDEQKDLIRKAAKEAVNKMFLEDASIFRDTSREKIESRIAKKIAVMKYFEQEKHIVNL